MITVLVAYLRFSEVPPYDADGGDGYIYITDVGAPGLQYEIAADNCSGYFCDSY